MATITVDNVAYEVKEGQNLLEACLSLGLDLPYFCWHPALGSVGACRQCAVKQFKDEHDTRGRIVMACLTPATNGVRIAIQDPEAREFRSSVIEWMLVNHPHDCPVCDEGGECHLQDMTVMTGHTYRRFRGDKRTFRNQDLGPFVNHEMNRCIQCYRCVRFYRDYADGRDFNAFVLRNHVYFGRHEDGILESEFSGNLVEVCPTGVFTDKTLKEHYTRKWDLQTAPSVCVHCGVGCNTIPGERYGLLRRIRNRYNGEVNGYFLCDRGRYGYEFVNGDGRIRHPLLRTGPEAAAQTTTREAALEHAATLLAGRHGVIGIGSPRASLEANHALRTLVGPDRFFPGLAGSEARLLSLIADILRRGPAPSASLPDAGQADAVLVLGEDVTNTAPMLALALRQSVRRQPMQLAEKLHIPLWDDQAVREALQEAKGPLFLAAPAATKLEDVATHVLHAAPDDLARLGFAVAHALDATAPGVADLPDALRDLAAAIAAALRGAKRPLVISGTGCGSPTLIQAAANVAWALCDDGRAAALGFVVPECNSLGLGLMSGGSLDDALEAVQGGTAQTVIILENDLFRRLEPAAAGRLLDGVRHVIAIDHLATPTTAAAEVVLPAGTFAESDGTLVNSEGRAQRFFQVLVPQGEVQESWRWLRDLMRTAGRPEVEAWHGLDDVAADLAAVLPVFRPVAAIAPAAEFRVSGLKIPRQPHRYSGRTAMHADRSVHEPQPPQDLDSPLAFSMEGYEGPPPAPLIPRYWAPGWNSVQALNKFQAEVGGPLRGGDPGRRLLEPAQGSGVAFFREVPAAFARRSGEWLILPAHHIFGSEELSILSPAVAACAPRPYLGMSGEDLHALTLEEGGTVMVALDGGSHRLPVVRMPGLPPGIVALPVSLPGAPPARLPVWGRVSRPEPEGRR